MTIEKSGISIFAAAFLLLGTLGVSFGEVSEAGSCVSCHSEMATDNLMMNISVHQPLLEGQCESCHVDENAEIDNGKSELQEGQNSNIHWLNRGTSPSKTQWFVISAQDLKQDIVVEARDEGNKRIFSEQV